MDASSLHTGAVHWSTFNLPAQRSHLDNTALLIDKSRERSAEARRSLSEQTKRFRGLPDADKLARLGQFVRSYQTEIDLLTQRAKQAEDAYLPLYRSLLRAPDPAPVFEAAELLAQKVDLMTAEVAQKTADLRHASGKLAEMEAEFETLQNQEVTIREQEATVRKLTAELETLAATRKQLRAKDSEIAQLQQSVAELEAHHLEQMKAVRKELETETLQHDQTKARLLDVSSKLESMEQIAESGSVMVLEDLDRLTVRSRSLEHERNELRAQVESLRQKSQEQISKEEAAHLETQIRTLRETVHQLEQRLHSAKREQQRAQDLHERQLASKNQDLQAARAEVEHVRAQLNSLPSPAAFAELQRKLHVLQTLEYGSPSDPVDGDQVDELLLTRSKRLASEVTELKTQLRDRDAQIESQTQRLAELESDAATKKQLIDELESQMRDISASSASIPRSQHAAMLNVVCGQRDRYRQRVEELEKQHRLDQTQAERQQRDLNVLRQDNLKLYEKLRYVREYKQDPDDSAELSDIRVSSGAAAEQRYAQLYEERQNPFREFKQRQQDARYRNLSLRERLTLSFGRFVFSRKSVRTCMFFYALFLHGLVFVTMWTHTVAPHCTHAHPSGLPPPPPPTHF